MSAVDDWSEVRDEAWDLAPRLARKADAAIAELEAELAALKGRRCETCRDSSETEHGDFCCEIGMEMVDYEPFPDNFFCSEWRARETP